MAKGNMLQGMARGKVGDVVFSRLNGEQISRVRNRYPRNPKTNAQTYQRAIMATVMAAYSAGKVIFDHSFQGKAVGSENQRYFLSQNAKHLRALIAADLNNEIEVEAQQGRVVAPGVSVPVPAPFKVSEGSLVNSLIVNGTFATADGATTLAEYCNVHNVVAGDIYTFVAFVVPSGATDLFEIANQNSPLSKHKSCTFVYARYQVKDSAINSTTPIASVKMNDLLQLTESNYNVPSTTEIDLADDVTLREMYNESAMGTYAWIRSRINEDLRSTETLQFAGNNNFGIASSYALAAWKQGSESIGDSDLILEGGDE